MFYFFISQFIILNSTFNIEKPADFQAFTKATEINELNISNFEISNDEDIKELAQGLKNSNVSKLYITNIDIDAEKFKLFTEVLKNSNVTGLYIENTRLANEGAIALAQVLKDSNVDSLGLSNNYIHEEGAIALAQALKDSKITSLHLRENKIGYEGIKALGENLEKLIALKLVYIDIDENRVKELFKYIKDSKLEKLSLHAKIDDNAAIALAQVLKDSNLKELYLQYNKIGSKGTKALAQLLKYSNVTKLYLGSNEIDNEGAIALANALRYINIEAMRGKRSKVEQLGLALNKNITDNGIKALVRFRDIVKGLNFTDQVIREDEENKRKETLMTWALIEAPDLKETGQNE